MQHELLHYFGQNGEKKYFSLAVKHCEAWKRFYLECGGSVYQSDFDHFLTTIDLGKHDLNLPK